MEQRRNARRGKRKFPEKKNPLTCNIVRLDSHLRKFGSASRQSCRTLPLAGGFSRGSTVSPALSFQRCSILASNHPDRLSRPR
ncbi:hypothetical protein PR048_023799 [Dryococelus australis]|uniref:Ribosomal protein S14 n=1 Tax=Dryococelus australis TaxID=614101 RepID=A0ABQ9GV41_9NEOP|nr:hypothetical protein PR048_023799 [Dryococelus australis]